MPPKGMIPMRSPCAKDGEKRISYYSTSFSIGIVEICVSPQPNMRAHMEIVKPIMTICPKFLYLVYFYSTVLVNISIFRELSDSFLFLSAFIVDIFLLTIVRNIQKFSCHHIIKSKNKDKRLSLSQEQGISRHNVLENITFEVKVEIRRQILRI